MTQTLGSWVVVVALGILPLFFLPFTQDPFDTNKWVVLVTATLLLLLLWGLRVITSGTVRLAWNGTTKRLGILAIASLASLLGSPNKVEAILAPFGPGTFLALFLIAAIGSTFLDDQAQTFLRWAIMTAASILGLFAIYQFFGLLGSDPLWTPTGTKVGLMSILIVSLPVIIHEVFHRKRSGHDSHMVVAIVMGLACIGGLALTAYHILPEWSQTTLPYWANWQILLESYKNWRQLLLGVGAENFLAAFTAGRPASLNMTPLWNARFTLGSSLAFHIATVYGLAGAVASGYFLSGFFKAVPFSAEMNGFAKLVAAFAFLLLPPSFSALIVIAALFIVSDSPTPLSFARHSLAKLIGIVVFLVVGTASYGLVRSYGAELAFARSLKAMEDRDGTGAYNLQITAITRNPQITRFHTAYSQTNLALANAISSAATASATPEQVDRDRQSATQLIQQAIREAKIAVNLAPQNILAWENISYVYQTLADVAQGADQWTVAAYSQAVQLDPTNPVLRLKLGGAYVGRQQFDRAAQSYTEAIALKPDWANAYYNLAFVYRQHKKYVSAALALRQTQALVVEGSDDERRVAEELAQVRALLTSEEQATLDATVLSTSVTDQSYPLDKPTLNPEEPAGYLLSPEASPPSALP